MRFATNGYHATDRRLLWTEGPLVERVVTVEPEAGLHARPASRFVETANRFDSTITVAPVDGGSKDGDGPTDVDGPADGEGSANDAGSAVDAGSMLAVTGLGVEHGEDVRLVAEGPDAEAALDALADLLSQPEP